jgi:hypothetical protein
MHNLVPLTPQAAGRRVVAAQLDTEDALPEQCQSMSALIASGGLDVSNARILLLGRVQAPAQRSVLWLEVRGAAAVGAAAWLQQSRGLVVLVASQEVRGHKLLPVQACSWLCVLEWMKVMQQHIIVACDKVCVGRMNPERTL